MKYPFISDSHTHSENSFDGKDSVIMLCEKAAQLGLYALTITDHCECHEYYQNNVRQDIEGSIRDILKARGLYTDRLHIYTGIELGQPTQDPKAAAEALSLAEYDFVLGSLHNLKGEQDFYFLQYTPDNVKDLLARYFAEITDMIDDGHFDSLAHLTYPFRYMACHIVHYRNVEKFPHKSPFKHPHACISKQPEKPQPNYLVKISLRKRSFLTVPDQQE